MSQTTEVVSAAWVSNRLSRPLRTVVRHAKEGKLPTIGRMNGDGAYLFDRAAIEALAEAGAA